MWAAINALASCRNSITDPCPRPGYKPAKRPIGRIIRDSKAKNSGFARRAFPLGIAKATRSIPVIKQQVSPTMSANIRGKAVNNDCTFEMFAKRVANSFDRWFD
jgi:hypothetical protein